METVKTVRSLSWSICSFFVNLEAPSGYGMGPPSMAGTPGPGPFAAPAGGYGSSAFGNGQEPGIPKAC